MVFLSVSETAGSGTRCTSRSHVLSSSNVASVRVVSPHAGSGEIPCISGEVPHVTAVTTTTSVGRLSMLPPPTPHRTTVTRSHSLRSTDRRCGVSNVVKRHSTSSVTTSPSSTCDSGRPQHQRRSAVLLPPPAWNVTCADSPR